MQVVVVLEAIIGRTLEQSLVEVLEEEVTINRIKASDQNTGKDNTFLSFQLVELGSTMYYMMYPIPLQETALAGRQREEHLQQLRTLQTV